MTAEVRSRGFTFAYTVVNISTGGLLVTGARPPPRGGLLEIEVRQTGARSVVVTGKMVHELPEGIGIAFEPFSTAVAESLEKLIAAVDARNNLPPPLPPGRAPKEEPPPLTGPDPFASGPEPRPPRSGSPDERIEYLRTLVKRRDESIGRGRTMFAAMGAETEELRAAGARLKAKLDATVGQLAVQEAALAAARLSAEKHQAVLEGERETGREMLDEEQRRTLEAIAAVAGLEAKMRRLETAATSSREEAEAARNEVREVAADAAGQRKNREELGAANKKAMETQVALTRERASRIAADAMVNESRAALQAADAEVNRLGSELARLKAKLIAAENALERSATRKAPAARVK